MQPPHPDPPSLGEAPRAEIYHAIYSGVPVYETLVRDVFVMRRTKDSFMNATQILKVAGLNKTQRTRVIEREVLLDSRHERVQVRLSLLGADSLCRAALGATRAHGLSLFFLSVSHRPLFCFPTHPGHNLRLCSAACAVSKYKQIRLIMQDSARGCRPSGCRPQRRHPPQADFRFQAGHGQAV
jgi:hypothetical protein